MSMCIYIYYVYYIYMFYFIYNIITICIYNIYDICILLFLHISYHECIMILMNLLLMPLEM